MNKLDIVRIDQARFAGKKLQYEYQTDSYYDVSMFKTGDSGWAAKLEFKKLPALVKKHFEGQLFEPYVENPIAYKCLSQGVDSGFLQLGFESWNKRMRIWEILVEPDFRQQGIGSLFIETAKAEARLLGARMLVLETQSCNVPAIAFYMKLGFELIGFDLASYSNEDRQKNEVRLEFGFPLR